MIVIAAAAARVSARIFVPVLAQLLRTRVPVLLPSTFGPGVFATPGVLAHAGADADAYTVTVMYDPQCEGQNVCAEGSLTGSRRASDIAAARRELHAARATPLVHGITGYYQEWVSGADDGGNSRLVWFAYGAVYTLETRISTRATLASIANSSLRNGPIPR